MAVSNDSNSGVNHGNFREKLLEAHMKVSDDQDRLNLLQKLQKEGLFTRDIMAFVSGQASLRVIDKNIHEPTARQAMTAKINDAKISLKHHLTERNLMRRKCKAIISNEGFNYSNIMRSIRQKTSKRKKLKKEKDEKKIVHLRNIQQGLKLDNTINRQFNPSSVPQRLSDYADLVIFKTPKDLPPKQQAIGPFICDPSIAISEGERLILSKDPKFSLRSVCGDLEFNTEVEKSTCKHRYNDQNEKKEKIRSQRIAGITGQKVVDQLTESQRLEQLWSQVNHKYTFDPFRKVVAFNKRRPTDYKLNSRVKLPRSIGADGEFQCEVKRRAFNNTFKTFQSLKDDGNQNNNTVILDKNHVSEVKNKKQESEAMRDLSNEDD